MWRVALAVLVVVAAGCSARRASELAPRPGATQEGMASWYGPGFHGNATTSGEIYNQHDLTAAHQTLPLGSRVAVTNLDNGRSVEVRINDRGPFARGRVIDLSYAAAQQIEMIGPGTVPVRIEVLGADATELPRAAYAVQVGSFADHGNAERLRAQLSRSFRNVYVSTLDANGSQYYRVRLGRFAARDLAREQARQAVLLGLPAVIVEDGAATN